MKKLISALLICSFTLALTGCGQNPNETGGTIIGAAAGGLLGSRFGSGSGKVLAGLAGAAIGGYVGNRIGAYMDRQDRMNYDRAVVTTPVGREATWSNPKRGTTYVVRPVRDYENHGRRCRKYRTTVDIKGKGERTAYGVVCKDKNGRWRIEK